MARPDDILARDRLHAFTRHTHVALAGSGRGPLARLAFGAKDIFDIAGHSTGFGSPEWFRTHPPATSTAPVVQRLLDAGADLVGRTHTDELTWSLFGENAHYGTPINPNAPGRVPGGSSSGSASAVAGGLVDFALGSDTGGSVRAPASFCGVYGLRTTHGRVPTAGACPLAPSFDTVGWFARDPEMLARVGDVLLAEDPPPASPARLLIATDAFALAGAEVVRALRPVIERLERDYGKAVEIEVSPEGLAQRADDFRVLQSAEVWAVHGEWVTRERPHLGPGVKERFDAASKIDPRDAEAAGARREAFARRMADMLAGNAIMLLPTVPGPAPLRGLSLTESNAFRFRCMQLLSIAGLARLPQISLPLARVEGLPLGLGVIAARGADRMLLELARAFPANRAD